MNHNPCSELYKIVKKPRECGFAGVAPCAPALDLRRGHGARTMSRSGIAARRFSYFSNPERYDKTNHLRLQGFFYRDF
jgi:hypothetical protein